MVASAQTVDPRTHRRVYAPPRPRPYEPRGGARELFFTTAPEVLLEGPAGTGKSLACLRKLDRNAIKYPGSRQLIVRKTRASLTQTGQVTFENQVIVPGGRVRFHTTLQAYLYPNGSMIVVGGMDKDSKVMSSEYDTIYVQEATELEEQNLEALTTRLRNGVIPHQQLIADCNPDSETHWLNRRCNDGKMRRLLSRHEDNPMLWNIVNEAWTERGKAYIAKLDALTGVRYKRLRRGQWAAAEGQVYEHWDPAIHLIDRFDIPEDWPRYWSIDFGYTNPFVWQAWALSPDNDLIRYREIYMTRRLVSDHAKTILEIAAGEPIPVEVITDHDAEDRATFEDETGYTTTPANKTVSTGLQAVARRLNHLARPNIRFMRDSLVERDKALADAARPTCTEEEFPSYVWDTRQKVGVSERPLKVDDHGQDATRYMVAHFDLDDRGPAFSDNIGDFFADLYGAP